MNINADRPSISLLNESSLLIQFSNKVNLEIAARIASLNAFIQEKHQTFVRAHIPAYSTLLLEIDIERISLDDFSQRLEQTIDAWMQTSHQMLRNTTATTPVTIPVYYDEEVGPDLVNLASSNSLSPQEAINIHHQNIYTIYTVGFAPGFAYMGNVDKRIAKPRLATPKQKVAAGSVGIAGRQTGIYPQASPGGWNIIGRTPLKLISIDAEGALKCPYKAGDRIKFQAIDRGEFLSLGGEL